MGPIAIIVIGGLSVVGLIFGIWLSSLIGTNALVGGIVGLAVGAVAGAIVLMYFGES